MSAATVLYLINFLNNLDSILITAIVLSTIYFSLSLFFTTLCRASGDDKDGKIQGAFLWNPIKKCWWILFLIIFISTCIPSEKTMYLMMGSSYLQSSEIPKKVELVLNKKLDEYLAEDKNKDSR